MEKFLVDRIKDVTLTKKEVLIANYFLKKQPEVVFMSSNEIARELLTSDSSIIRFARKLGYSGFIELQEDLRKQVSEHINNKSQIGLSPSERFERRFDAFSDGNLVKKVLDTTINNISTSFEQNGAEKYEEMAERLVKSKRKYIIGFRGAKGLAVHFARTLRYIMEDVVEITSADTSAFELLQGIGREDTAVLISFSRYGKVDSMIRELLVEKNIPFCVITDKAVAPIAKNADILLIAETSSMGFFHSTTSVLFIIELVVTIVGKKLGSTAKGNLSRLDKYLFDMIDK